MEVYAVKTKKAVYSWLEKAGLTIVMRRKRNTMDTPVTYRYQIPGGNEWCQAEYQGTPKVYMSRGNYIREFSTGIGGHDFSRVQAKEISIFYHARRMKGTQNAGMGQDQSCASFGNAFEMSLRSVAGRTGSFPILGYGLDGNTGRLTTTIPSSSWGTIVARSSICIAFGWMIRRIVLGVLAQRNMQSI